MQKLVTSDWMQEILTLEGIDKVAIVLRVKKKINGKKCTFSEK